MITAIEQALSRCSADKFANLCRLYLAYRFPIVNASGLVVGKEKSKKGTPDNFVPDGENFIFNEITTIDKKGLVAKLKQDISHCFVQKDIPVANISKILLICNQEITTAIQKEISDYKNTFHNVADLEVIGIDAFATIIFRDYPSIARDLGLPIDTGQILEMADFITQYEKSKFATPLSNKFYNRKTELKESIKLLKQTDYLLITGPAGVGKTKFSIEIATNFHKTNPQYVIKYIRNNNQLIWEDLKVQIVKDKKYLIVVDDANKLKSNLTSIINFKNEFDDSAIKIILTVRNYVKSQVQDELKKFGEIVLNNFEKGELMTILQSPDFKITNYYANKIFSISKGNPRIALMAAIAGINKDLEKLNKASLILEEYFSSANNTIRDDLAQLKVAGILSMFRTIDISNQDQLDEISDYFEIEKNVIIEKLSSLVENELADEFKSTYKIADQILGEYIFYLIFIKERHIPFLQLLDLYFDQHKISLMRLLNPIISNYGFDEIKQLIIGDLKTKWDSLKNDSDKAIKFLDSFWFFLQTETLIYTNKQIVQLPSLDVSALKFELYKDNYIETYDDKLISLLVNFKNIPEKFEIALELLMKYGISNELIFTKILKAFKQSFIYERFSYEYGYKAQMQLFKFLFAKIPANPMFYSKIIIFIADKFLIDVYQYTEGGDGRKFYFGNMRIILTEAQKEFRTNLFKFIFDCYKQDQLKDDVLSFFDRHHYSHEREKSIIAFDKNLIIPFFLTHFKKPTFRESMVVKNYLRTLHFSKVRFRKEAKKLINSGDFKLWLRLEKKFERDETLLDEFADYRFEEYRNFFDALDRIAMNKTGTYSCIEGVISPVSDVLQDIGQKDFPLFIEVLQHTLQYSYAIRLHFGKILSHIDFSEEKLNLLRPVFKAATNGDLYLMELFTRVPKEFLKIEDYQYLVDVVNNPEDKNAWFIDQLIRRVPDLNLDIAAEIKKLLELILLKIETHENLYMDCDFFKTIYDYNQSLFTKNINLIEKIYLYFDNQQRHFDYDLEVLKTILSHNPGFIIDLLKYNFDDKHFISRRDFSDNDFKRLWDLENYEIVFDKMLNYLVKFNRGFGHRTSEFANAFRGDSKVEIEFLKTKIVDATDNDVVELVFNLVSTVYRDKMFEFLEIILEKGCDLELFRRLDFYTSEGVTVGSRLPGLQFELTQYEKVLQFLHEKKNIAYLEFIELVERNVMYSKLRIERERKQEFTEEWD